MDDIQGLRMLARVLEDNGKNTFIILNQLD